MCLPAPEGCTYSSFVYSNEHGKFWERLNMISIIFKTIIYIIIKNILYQQPPYTVKSHNTNTTTIEKGLCLQPMHLPTPSPLPITKVVVGPKEPMPLLNTFWGSRVNNGDTTDIVAKMYVCILTFLLKRHSLKISRDIFFKTSPCLYGTIFGPLETIKGCGVLFGKSLTSQDRLNSL